MKSHQGQDGIEKIGPANNRYEIFIAMLENIIAWTQKKKRLSI